ncbi:MAG: hypothetical protein WDW36_006076 [Sanguina aurantia]
MGFTLQASDFNRMLELATTVQESQIVSDNSLPADQNVEVLKSTVRLLQLALDSQFQEVRIMTEELNDLEEESKGFDERERRLQDENDRMREMRDRDAQAGDAVEMRRKIEDLTKQRDIERNNANQLRERQESCDRRVIAAEDKVQVLDNKLRDSEEKGYRLQQDLGALQREHEQLRETFDRMSNELASAASKNKMDDNSKQQGWKLERLSKENRALELQNTELRKQLTDIKAENLEVSEAIVLLDDEVRGQRSNASDVEARIEELVADKAGLISIGDQLRVDIQDKMALLDEFEDKFARQYRSWEEEKLGLLAQIQGLQREAVKGGGGGGGNSFRRSSTHVGGGHDDEPAEQMREALDEAKEKEILLLEAYEQLEQDVGKEVDRALARQGEEMARLARRVEFLQGKLEDGYNVGEGAREQQAVLEARLKDAAARNAMYEKDIYGLPQAVEEIKSLQVAVTAEEGRCKGFILQVNMLSKKVEDLYDENGVLRRLAGVSATAAVDIRDIRTQKESSIAQLRSLNALLERQVADLEEERRKLRMEMKFRAKYHGQAALSLGLSPEQLLLVEQFVDDLKGLRSDEARLVEQLQKRIEFLERGEQGAGWAAAAAATRGGGGGGGGGGGHIVASQVEAVKASMLKALGQLRQMHQSLGEARSVSSADYAKYVDGVLSTMTDAERAVDIILKDARAAAAQGQALTDVAGGGGGVPSTPVKDMQLSLTPGSPRRQQRVAGLAGDAGFLADAIADELREKLRALARQLADLQVAVIAKDAHIAQLGDSKAAMGRKFGVPVTERQAEFVTSHEYQDLFLANSSLKEQLISALEELGARELEAGELHDAGLKTQARMQSFVDQIRLLYREHAGALAGWKVERQGLEKRVSARETCGQASGCGRVPWASRSPPTVPGIIVTGRWVHVCAEPPPDVPSLRLNPLGPAASKIVAAQRLGGPLPAGPGHLLVGPAETHEWLRVAHTVTSVPSSDGTQSSHRAPDRTQNGHRSLHRTQNGHWAPDRTRNGHRAPDRTQDGHGSLHWTQNGHRSSDATQNGHRAPDGTQNGHRSLHRTQNGHWAPDRTRNGHRAPDGAQNGHRAPDATQNGHRAPDGTQNGHRASDATQNGHRAPDRTQNGHRASDATQNGHRSSDATQNGHRASDAAQNGHRAPDGAQNGHRAPDGTQNGHRASDRTQNGHRAPDGTQNGRRASDRTQNGHRAPDRTQNGHRAPDGTQNGHRASDRTQNGHRAPDRTQNGHRASDATQNGHRASDATQNGHRSSDATQNGHRAQREIHTHIACSQPHTPSDLRASRVKKLSQDSEGYKAALEVSDRGLASLREARGAGELHKEFVDTVRRMAMVQIKHAKVARELATSVLCESQLQERVGELEEEVRDVTSTARGRMRWLEAAADQSSQRAEGLFRELEGAAPLQAYQLLVAKHSRLQSELRRLVEERGDAVAVGDHELFRLRDELAELVTHNSATADEAAELREKLRLALLAAGASKFGGPGALDGQLAAELVSARVREESLGRRAELVERERDRGLRTLQETQERLRELEERAAQGAADLTRSRATASDLQARLQGGRGKEAVDALLKRVEVAEAAAAAVTRRTDHESYQTEESQRRLEGSLRDTQRHLAETTNLRSALRDAMGRGGDGAQLVGRLHLELDHSRAKESLARNALNRSELQRIELEKEMRRGRAMAASLGTQVTAMHEQASWADRQRHEAQATLDISLAGCTEGWKAKLWARKLEQLKARNEALADGLDTSRARVQKLESARVEYQLRSDHAQESSAMLGKGPSEAAREAARLSEQLLVLKLERGRLQREEVLLKEKVHYTERVNAELHELLERYEGEFYGTQVPGAGGGRGRVGGGRVQLEGERAAAVVRAKGLQDEVTKCQERINVLLAGPGGDVGGCTDRPGQGGRRLIAASGTGTLARGAHSERDALLKQIDTVKAARQEAESLRSECQRLQVELSGTTGELVDVRRHHNEALQRLHEQSEALLYALNHHKSKGHDETAVEQMQAITVATLDELKGRVRERDLQLATLHGRMQEELGRFLAQHQADRGTIETLNQKLFERNDASIDDLRVLQAGSDAQAALLLLREQLKTEKDSNAALEKELFAVRTRAQKLKNIRESVSARSRGRVYAQRWVIQVVDLTTGMSIEAKRQIDDFQKRIKVLEQQNQQLRRHSEAVGVVVGALAGGEEGGPPGRARATARPTGPGVRPSSATPATATARRPTSSSSGAATATTLQSEASARAHVDASYSQQRGSESGAGGPGAGSGTHGAPDPQAASRAAIAAWEETKKLNAKIELLRRKLVVKVEEVATHQKEADRRISQLSALQAELDKQAAVIRDLQQERTARRAAAAAAATAGSQSEKAGSQSAQGGLQSVQPGSRSMAESAAAASQPARLLEYAHTLSAVEGERDTLLLQLGRLQHSARPPAPRPAAGSVEDLLLAKDADLFGLKLELDQARAAVKRMRDRMAEIVTANLDQSAGPTPQSSSKLPGPQRRPPAGGPVISVREAELITMIDNLKSALEKAATNVTPTTKYMQEVGRRRECQREAEARHAEAESLRKQLQSARHMLGEVQASNAELRNTVRDQQTGSSQAGGAAGAALRGLERSLAQREAEVSALRQGLAESMAARQAQAGQAAQHTGGAGSSSSSGRVAELESQLHESQVENQDLRNELNAFDPGFFEEIEDLKHEHHQLTGRAAEYERTIAQLSAQLGRPVPGSAVMTSGR